MLPINCYYTDHFINQTVIQFFSKSLGLPLLKIDEYKDNEKYFASYGILRGTELILKKKFNYIYIDHGYFNASKRKFTKERNTIISELNGYFRIIKNDLYFNKDYLNNDTKRFEKLNITLKDKVKGNKIILSEPTQNTLNFLNQKNWKENTIKEIKKYTDREIIIHNKFSEIPLHTLFENAFAFVSCQSTAGFLAISQGVPSYFTHNSLKNFGDIKDIEKNNLNHSLLYNAANTQWSLKEFFNDEFEQFMSRILDT